MYVAFELGNRKWKLAISNGQKVRLVDVEAREMTAIENALADARRRLNVKDGASIYSCYEAGGDGFWLHRWLVEKGIANVVVDSSSIEVTRKYRRAKTDRLDAEKLVSMLMRHVGGETKVWQVCRVPTVEQEDDRQPQRELRLLLEDETRLNNQIRAQLKLFGLAPRSVLTLDRKLSTLRCGDGTPLPPLTVEKLRRLFERRKFVSKQIREVREERRDRLESSLKAKASTATDSPESVRQQTVSRKVFKLMGLCGIGQESSWLCMTEFFSWRQFKNRRQVAGSAGLVPVPFNSGDSNHDQGISKGGNSHIRSMLIQISWGWLQYQPQSALSRWYQQRFASGGKAGRKKGIVALARRLLIALWRYVEFDELPAGAKTKELISLT